MAQAMSTPFHGRQKFDPVWDENTCKVSPFCIPVDNLDAFEFFLKGRNLAENSRKWRNICKKFFEATFQGFSTEALFCSYILQNNETHSKSQIIFSDSFNFSYLLMVNYNLLKFVFSVKKISPFHPQKLPKETKKWLCKFQPWKILHKYCYFSSFR